MRHEDSVILVVDDEESIRELITRQLERAGYQVVSAPDGPTALERLETSSIDLVVLDILMPGLSGLEVLKKIRQSYSAQELPVLVATAQRETDDVVKALELGANDYVTKPLDIPVTLARLKTLLRMHADFLRSFVGQSADHVRHLDDIKPGMVLGGKYQLEELLGSGNYGVVLQATDLNLDRQVAVKILHTLVEESSTTLTRFRQEGQSAFRLQHPNVVDVSDFSVTPHGLAYMVMERLEGRSLDEELKGREEWMSEQRAATVTLPICHALTAAHDLGILHRDIKPANIFLHHEGGREIVKVLDFGTAKLVGAAATGRNLTLEHQILGTPAYMAPERVLGEDYDGRTDAYSLGVMLYEMLSGCLPIVSKDAIRTAMMQIHHEPKPLSQLRPGISAPFEETIMSLLAKDIDQRLSVRDLASCLELIPPT